MATKEAEYSTNVTGLEYVQVDVTSIPPLTAVSCTATAPAGKKVTGGGFAIATYPDVICVRSVPGSSLQSWTCVFYNTHPTATRTDCAATYAVCADAD